MAVGIVNYGAGTRRSGRGKAPARLSPSEYDPNDPAGVAGTSVYEGVGSTGTTGSTSGTGFTLVDEDDGGGGSSLSGQAAMLRAQLAQKEYEDKLAASNISSERARAGAQESLNYLKNLLDVSGRPFGGLETQIAAQESAGRQYIEDQAKMLSDLISGRRTQAMDVTTRGYDALRNYLAANPMQAYAQTQRAMPTVQQNALSQYMASRGVEGAPAQAGQDVVNAQLAAQAANYNQLLNVLTGAETQQQASRAAEEQMARSLAGTQLEQLYGAQTSGLEQQRLAALSDLASRVAAARLQAEQTRLAREQALQDAIAKLLGSGFVKAPTVSGAVTPESAFATLNQLAPTDPNAPADMMLRPTPPVDELVRLIALAQQSPQYTGGGAGGGVTMGNEAVMF